MATYRIYYKFQEDGYWFRDVFYTAHESVWKAYKDLLHKATREGWEDLVIDKAYKATVNGWEEIDV